MHGLWGEANVRDDGDLGVGHAPHERCPALAAFDLDRVRPRFLEQPRGVADAVGDGHMVRAVGHIRDEEGTLHTASDGAGVMQHLVHGDGESVVIAKHGHANGVADENDVDASLIDQARCGVVVRCQGRNRLTGAFHFKEGLRSHRLNALTCSAVAELSKAHFFSPVPLRFAAADEARTTSVYIH